MAYRFLQQITSRYFQIKGYQVDQGVAFPVPHRPVTHDFTGPESIDVVAQRYGDPVIVRCEPDYPLTWDSDAVFHLTEWLGSATFISIRPSLSSPVPYLLEVRFGKSSRVVGTT